MFAANRILIYEPDAESVQAMRAAPDVASGGFVWCGTAAKLVALIAAGQVDAVVVCLAADGAGLDMLERIGKTVPVLVAAPAEALEVRIAGLKLGACDYLIKPFGTDELMARVATVLHRRATARGPLKQLGDLQLDMQVGRIGDGARWTMLTPTECQAFSLLLEQAYRPVSKDRLKSALTCDKDMSDNAIEVIIHRLRAKARTWNMRIRTYRGAGYALEPA
jgi:DNA-binding response OmpR family regulator